MKICSPFILINYFYFKPSDYTIVATNIPVDKNE